MSGVAACLDSASRERLLRELGIEPMRLRAAGSASGSESGKCLLLLPQAARDDAAQAALAGQILAAADLPEERVSLLWVQPGSTLKPPLHSVCLVLGEPAIDAAHLPEDAVHHLASPADLLRECSGKRGVWRALRLARGLLAAET